MIKAFILTLVIWPGGWEGRTPVTVYASEIQCRKDATAIMTTKASVVARCDEIAYVGVTK